VGEGVLGNVTALAGFGLPPFKGVIVEGLGSIGSMPEFIKEDSGE